jgi:hypothetical protein
VVNYSIVKGNAATITGQAHNVAEAVAAVNRAQADRWSSEGMAFVAVFVGNDAVGAYPMVQRAGAWWAPDVEAFEAKSHTFGSLPLGALFTLPGNVTLWRKHDDKHGKKVGGRSRVLGFRPIKAQEVVVPAN